jgi:hypothetical protein
MHADQLTVPLETVGALIDEQFPRIDTRARTFAGRGGGGGLRSHNGWMETCFRHS